MEDPAEDLADMLMSPEEKVLFGQAVERAKALYREYNEERPPDVPEGEPEEEDL